MTQSNKAEKFNGKKQRLGNRENNLELGIFKDLEVQENIEKCNIKTAALFKKKNILK